MRVLIAEDEAITRHLLTTMVGRWGYEAVAAADGADADAVMAGDDPPRIAIVDWMMPGLDGPSLCRAIRGREATRQTRIVLVTGKGREGDAEAALEAGADEVMSKPVDYDELERWLAEAVRSLR